MDNFRCCFAYHMNNLLEDWTANGHRPWPVRRSLFSFDSYCIRSGIDSAQLTKDIVCGWLQEECDRSIGSELKVRVALIKKLARYIVASGGDAYVLPVGYMTRYTPKRRHRINLLSDDGLSKFFVAVDTISPSQEVDPWVPEVAPVMFRMLYTCGLRPNEVREIKCDDVNMETGEILIRHNKELKQRIVVMSEDMKGMCNRYLSRKAFFAPDEEYLFPRQKGGLYTGKLLTALFQRCWKRANLDICEKNLRYARPYDLRHRFASMVLQKWIDEKKNLFSMLPYLSSYMGHTGVSATAYYIHILPENLLKSTGVSWNELDEMVPEVAVWEK